MITTGRTSEGLRALGAQTVEGGSSKSVRIVNELGLHARPAMLIVELAGSFASQITIVRDDQRVNAKSVMEILLLAATQGTELRIEADGPDAQAAVAALASLVERGFDEE